VGGSDPGYQGREATEPILGEDYYLENGLLVMTAAYHRKRGYCCGSGCRHCPYLPKHQLGSSVLESSVLEEDSQQG
jgi:hypothetical protein